MEYDYEKELFYHTICGFKIKIHDIIVLLIISIGFMCICMVDCVRYAIGRMKKEEINIEMMPLQELRKLEC